MSIRRRNWYVKELNEFNSCVTCVHFLKHGVRKVTRKSVDIYGEVTNKEITTHKWEHWRKVDKSNMLHLRDDGRFVLGKTCQKYFIERTDKATSDNLSH